MRTLGIDYGAARLGLAISDDEGRVAVPLTTLHEKDRGAQIRRVVEAAAERDVARFVVGVPLDEDGEAGPMAETAERFAAKLERVTGLPVHRQDERFSSFAAEQALDGVRAAHRKRRRREKGDVDALAACYILQAFLDAEARR